MSRDNNRYNGRKVVHLLNQSGDRMSKNGNLTPSNLEQPDYYQPNYAHIPENNRFNNRIENYYPTNAPLNQRIGFSDNDRSNWSRWNISANRPYDNPRIYQGQDSFRPSRNREPEKINNSEYNRKYVNQADYPNEFQRNYRQDLSYEIAPSSDRSKDFFNPISSRDPNYRHNRERIYFQNRSNQSNLPFVKPIDNNPQSNSYPSFDAANSERKMMQVDLTETKQPTSNPFPTFLSNFVDIPFSDFYYQKDGLQGKKTVTGNFKTTQLETSLNNSNQTKITVPVNASLCDKNYNDLTNDLDPNYYSWPTKTISLEKRDIPVEDPASEQGSVLSAPISQLHDTLDDDKYHLQENQPLDVSLPETLNTDTETKGRKRMSAFKVIRHHQITCDGTPLNQPAASVNSNLTSEQAKCFHVDPSNTKLEKAKISADRHESVSLENVEPAGGDLNVVNLELPVKKAKAKKAKKQSNSHADQSLSQDLKESTKLVDKVVFEADVDLTKAPKKKKSKRRNSVSPIDLTKEHDPKSNTESENPKERKENKSELFKQQQEYLKTRVENIVAQSNMESTSKNVAQEHDPKLPKAKSKKNKKEKVFTLAQVVSGDPRLPRALPIAAKNRTKALELMKKLDASKRLLSQREKSVDEASSTSSSSDDDDEGGLMKLIDTSFNQSTTGEQVVPPSNTRTTNFLASSTRHDLLLTNTLVAETSKQPRSKRAKRAGKNGAPTVRSASRSQSKKGTLVSVKDPRKVRVEDGVMYKFDKHLLDYDMSSTSEVLRPFGSSESKYTDNFELPESFDSNTEYQVKMEVGIFHEMFASIKDKFNNYELKSFKSTQCKIQQVEDYHGFLKIKLVFDKSDLSQVGAVKLKSRLKAPLSLVNVEDLLVASYKWNDPKRLRLENDMPVIDNFLIKVKKRSEINGSSIALEGLVCFNSWNAGATKFLRKYDEVEIMLIGSMSTFYRSYLAVQNLSKSSLNADILCSSYVIPPFDIDSHLDSVHATQVEYGLNFNQADAVNKSVSLERGILPIIGPPGTGKTRTVAAIVDKLLKLKSTQEFVRTNKILVCTPSNTAIDEIVDRIGKGIPTNQGTSFPKIVRIGAINGCHAKVRKFDLDYLVDLKLQAQINYDLNDYFEAADKFFARIDGLRDEVKKLKESIDILPTWSGEAQSARNKVVELNQVIEIEFENRQVLMDKLEKERSLLKRGELLESEVIATTLGSSGNEYLSRMGLTFDIVIIDEAGQALEVDCIIPLQYEVQKLILVGDPKQLPPTLLAPKSIQLGFDSLLARLLKTDSRNQHLLNTQYRMHPLIAKLPNKLFYGCQLKDAPDMAQKRQAIWHDDYRFRPYLFYNVAGKEFLDSNRSFNNRMEAKAILDFIVGLVTSFPQVDFVSKIAVLVPYNAQLHLFKQLATDPKNNICNLRIEFSTIDGFQGQEADIVILSCVRASKNGGIGFVSDSRRMNVALTRARLSVFVFGDRPSLSRDPLWQRFLNLTHDDKLLVDYNSTDFVPLE